MVVDPLDLHPAEGIAIRPYVGLVLKQRDGVDDVVRDHRLAVVPRRVVPDLEGPDLAVFARGERLRQIALDGAVAAIPAQPAEDEADDVLVDGRRSEDRVEVLRGAGHTLHVGAAVCGHDGLGLSAVDRHRGAADDDHQPDQCDDDELVAGPHLDAG